MIETNLDVHAIRVLILLGESGALSRWEITQRRLTSVKADVRRHVYEELERRGYVTTHIAQKLKGPGPRPKMYELSAKGKAAYRRMVGDGRNAAGSSYILMSTK